MRQRRTNLLWGFVVLAVALIAMASALGLLPPPILDLLVRAWPALLVLAGLAFLLRGRVPAGSLIAVVVAIAITVGVAAYSFSSRAQERRTDNQTAIDVHVPDDTALLRVRVHTLATDIEILRGVEPGITGTFAGSLESQIAQDYAVEPDSSATFTLREARPNAIPMLAAVGRGALRLELPPDVPLDVELIGADGAMTVNMGDTRLERLTVDLARGNALVVLPAYEPIFTPAEQSLGTLAVRGGDITVVLPSTVAGRLELDRGGSGIEPEYDPNVYNFLFNRLLEARAIESADLIVQYTIVAPSGRIRLQVEGEG